MLVVSPRGVAMPQRRPSWRGRLRYQVVRRVVQLRGTFATYNDGRLQQPPARPPAPGLGRHARVGVGVWYGARARIEKMLPPRPVAPPGGEPASAANAQASPELRGQAGVRVALVTKQGAAPRSAQVVGQWAGGAGWWYAQRGGRQRMAGGQEAESEEGREMRLFMEAEIA